MPKKLIQLASPFMFNGCLVLMGCVCWLENKQPVMVQ